jgi:sarcosine oxidase
VDRTDVVIVGGGVMGTAAARALAERGRATIVLERFELGHSNGSSGGPTRNFRLTYHDPIYVRMARASLERWRRLEAEADVELLRVVGGLDVGEAAVRTSGAALEASGESFERPSAAEAAQRWPRLRLDGRAILYQPEGAIIRADEAVSAQARLATAAGAEIREHTVVRSIRPAGEGVEVLTSEGETILAPTGIVAAGGWAPSLLADADIRLPLRVLQEQSTVFDREPGLATTPTVIDWEAWSDRFPYIVPNAFAPGEIKVGIHLSGPVVDPDTRTFDPDPEREAQALEWVGRLVSPPPSPSRTESCLYGVTPDEDFVLDRVGPIVVTSPCSGHGFKFAPLIGEIAASLANGEAPPVSLTRFRLDRRALRP